MNWLWSLQDSSGICFCGLWPSKTCKSIPIILILLTNKTVKLIYSDTISEQKSKDCVRSGRFQHKLRYPCFHRWCLPPFISGLLRQLCWKLYNLSQRRSGSFYDTGKLSTYPYPKLIFRPKWKEVGRSALSQNRYNDSTIIAIKGYTQRSCIIFKVHQKAWAKHQG